MERIFDNSITIALQPDAATGRPARMVFQGLTALPESFTIKWSYQIQLLTGEWQHQRDFLQKADADTRVLPETGEMISMQELQQRIIIEHAEYDENGQLIKAAVLADIVHQSEGNFWWEQLGETIHAIKQAGQNFAVRRQWKSSGQ